MAFTFWLSLFILFYSYIGYGILLYLLVRIQRVLHKRRQNSFAENELPTVSLIIAAYNEAAIMEKKIQNCLELDYPSSKLEIIFVIDGSNDESQHILDGFPQIRSLYDTARKGKTAALNRAVSFAGNDILIFSDANTLLNRAAVLEISKKYADPLVAGVAGEKKVMQEDFKASDEGEGLYWKYESTLKKLDSELYTVVGAAGELFSLRKELFEPVDERVIQDDFIISMKLTMKGYTVKYASEAYAMELPSDNIKEELKRKIRISAGAFQSMGMLLPLLNVFRYGVVSFQYISHRVLRWTLCPLCMLLLLFSNFFLLDSDFFRLVLVLQLFFYAAALTGWSLLATDRKPGPFYVPFYFSFMNYALVLGFFRFTFKTQNAAWEKSKRKNF